VSAESLVLSLEDLNGRKFRVHMVDMDNMVDADCSDI